MIYMGNYICLYYIYDMISKLNHIYIYMYMYMYIYIHSIWFPTLHLAARG